MEEKKEGDKPKSIQEEILEKQRAEMQSFEILESEEKIKEVEMGDKETKEKRQDKKIKNLISLVILLTGLFIGSLFVDVSQLVKGSGYSQKNLNKSDIFETRDKTWVAYDMPAVSMSVISDDTCDKCDPSELLVWLRRVMPTISVNKINFDSEEGKKLIDKFGIKSLPVFIFDTNVEKTDLYSQAKELFKKENGQYVMNTQFLGMPIGKYLSTPSVDSSDVSVGKSDAEVKVVVFSDFQCPYCKTFFGALQATISKYQDKVQFVFKDLPLDIHPQATDAAIAAGCAQDQGKFWEYANKLYASQAEWGNAKDIIYFKNYAVSLKLDTAKFNKCLDDKAHQDKIDAVKKEADSFSVSGTPTVFVNDQMESGVVSADQLGKDIEAQLNK